MSRRLPTAIPTSESLLKSFVNILNANGTAYRRKRRHILPVNEPAPRYQETIDNDILMHPALQPQQANHPPEVA